MGQYRQWLHSQEVDQQLRSRLKQLTDELAQLQAQALHLEDTTSSCTDNAIIQALVRQQEALSVPVPDTQETLSESTSPDDLEIISLSSTPNSTTTDVAALTAMPAIPISPTLFAWGHLPNFDSQKMQLSQPVIHSQEPVPSTPRPDTADLLPQDMSSFFNEESEATSQVKLPTWLEKAITSSTTVQRPVDQQAARTNRLIQRWVERWGRASAQSGQREDQHHEQ